MAQGLRGAADSSGREAPRRWRRANKMNCAKDEISQAPSMLIGHFKARAQKYSFPFIKIGLPFFRNM
jgi:hypothetical protein